MIGLAQPAVKVGGEGGLQQRLMRRKQVQLKVAQAVQLVMGFSLLAGVLVLLAALQATAGERRYDSAVLRTLGARRGQLRGAVLVEFGALGLLAALLAVTAAAVIGAVVGQQAHGLHEGGL